MSQVGQRLIKAVRETAAKNPGYVYPDICCLYVADGSPSCLLGHALWDLDMITPSLSRMEVNNEGIGDLLQHLGVEVDDNEMEWLSTTQEGQDAHRPWGTAVWFADNVNDEMLAKW